MSCLFSKWDTVYTENETSILSMFLLLILLDDAKKMKCGGCGKKIKPKHMFVKVAEDNWHAGCLYCKVRVQSEEGGETKKGMLTHWQQGLHSSQSGVFIDYVSGHGAGGVK